MREVLLIGGPYDGKATDVPDALPAYHLIAELDAFEPVVRELGRINESTAMHLIVHRYRREIMHWTVASNVQVYVYAGRDY